jgi:hypothetical protein
MLTVLCCFLPRSQCVAAPATPVRKTSFAEVTAQLEPGGNLFGYASADQWLGGLSTNLSQLRDLAVVLPNQPFGDRDQIDRVFDLVSKLTRLSGLEDLTGVGMSGIQIAPALYRTKIILHHPAGAGRGFLWSLFGGSPHAWRGLDLLPEETALAFHTDLDLLGLWQVLNRELTKSGLPAVEQWARQWPETFERQTGIPWARLLTSLGGELGLVLTLDSTRHVQLPAGNQEFELPAPGLLISIKVNDDLLYDRFSQLLKANPQARTTEMPRLKLCQMPLPAPPELGLELALAAGGGYFFIATSAELVRAALGVQSGARPGLKATAEFNALALYAPTNGNQFLWVSRRFGEAFGALQRQALIGAQMPPQLSNLLPRLLGGAQPAVNLSVRAHTDTGWQSTSVGNQDPTSTLLLAPTVGVTAVAAGMLLPALAKAKAKAQTIQSVNQLKQVGLAARIYANDHGDTFPLAERWCDTLKGELGNPGVLKAPNDPSAGGCSYAYNAKLSGKKEGEVAPNTVMFFETTGGWNQHGGRELLLQRPRSVGVYVIGLADGSVQQVSPERIDSLRWDP